MELTRWWTSMGVLEQLSWVIACVASALTLMYFLFKAIPSQNSAGESQQDSDFKSAVLMGLFIFGWLNVILQQLVPGLGLVGVIGFSVLVAIISGWAIYQSGTSKQRSKALLERTGQVLQSIPPNQQGTGKIYLQARHNAFELNAVTIGNELPEGVPIRVVEVREDGTVVVEPIPVRPDSQSTEYHP